MREEYREKSGRDPLPLMGSGDPDLVDPELGYGLIGVNVVHAAGHADYEPILDRNGQVQAWILKMCGGGLSVDGVVEDALGNVAEHSDLVSAQEPKFKHGSLDR